MTNKYEQTVKYFFNVDRNRLYRITNNKYIHLWVCSRLEWSRCATEIHEVYNQHYAGRYILVNETSVPYYKQKEVK